MSMAHSTHSRKDTFKDHPMSKHITAQTETLKAWRKTWNMSEEREGESTTDTETCSTGKRAYLIRNHRASGTPTSVLKIPEWNWTQILHQVRHIFRNKIKITFSRRKTNKICHYKKFSIHFFRLNRSIFREKVSNQTKNIETSVSGSISFWSFIGFDVLFKVKIPITY